MRVYHLSEAQYALSDVALRRIKISRFSDLNDPFELLGANLNDKEARKAFRRSKEEIDRNRGLLCFSSFWDNPVLWSHYADKHRGVCLGFDAPDHLLEPVIYAARRMKIDVNWKLGRPKMTEKFVNALLRTKFADWRYEDEYRIFVGLDHGTVESGLYFYTFSRDLVLREVILGPRCELPIGRVRDLVADFDPRVLVIKARLAFTKFKVIENKVATRKRLKT